MDFDERSYDITVSRGAIKHASELFALDRRVLVVTDDGVPAQYSKAIADAAGEPHILTIRHGEASKCPERYLEILKFMLACGFDRHDCVVAVGGGVVGDLAGFAAATYMRGIDLYNIPTTLLSQVDSSVGGKRQSIFWGIKMLSALSGSQKELLLTRMYSNHLMPDNSPAECLKLLKCSQLLTAKCSDVLKTKLNAYRLRK